MQVGSLKAVEDSVSSSRDSSSGKLEFILHARVVGSSYPKVSV